VASVVNRRWTGTSTQNSEPRSTSLVTPIWILISSASRLVIVRPIPVPSIGPVSLDAASASQTADASDARRFVKTAPPRRHSENVRARIVADSSSCSGAKGDRTPDL
jgi:hypothetical protein